MMTRDEYAAMWAAGAHRIANRFYPHTKSRMTRGYIIRLPGITLSIGANTRRSEFLRDIGLMGGFVAMELESRNMIRQPDEQKPDTGKDDAQ